MFNMDEHQSQILKKNRHYLEGKCSCCGSSFRYTEVRYTQVSSLLQNMNLNAESVLYILRCTFMVLKGLNTDQDSLSSVSYSVHRLVVIDRTAAKVTSRCVSPSLHS